MKLDRRVAAAFTGALDPFFVVGGLLLYLLKSPRQKRLCDPISMARITKATELVAFFFPIACLFVATQYEISFKLSTSTFHVSIMAITPAIASHKVGHPSR